MLQALWTVLIVVLLLVSHVIPSAFIGVLIVFYVPIIIGIIYMIAQLIGPFWFSVALMCLGLCLV
jgi:hypothetical protein